MTQSFTKFSWSKALALLLCNLCTLGYLVSRPFFPLQKITDRLAGVPRQESLERVLEIPQEIHLEPHYQGRHIQTQVELTNLDTSTTALTQVSSFCGCTWVAPKKTVLEAGETSLLQISLSTEKLEPKFVREIVLRTNKGQKPYFLNLRGQLTPLWEFSKWSYDADSQQYRCLLTPLQKDFPLSPGQPIATSELAQNLQIQPLDQGRFQLSFQLSSSPQRSYDFFWFLLPSGIKHKPWVEVPFTLEKVS